MNVNEKGVIGLTKVIADLTSRGYICFTPIADYSPVDLIATDSDMQPVRVQVKYREATLNDRIEIPIASVVNGRKVKADRQKIDGWAIFCPTTASIYYVGEADIPKGSSYFTISLKRSKRSPRFADDFRDPKILWKGG